MASLDIILGVFLAIFILIGLWKGFFREVLGLVGIIGGIFLGIVGFGPLSNELNRILPDIPSFIWPFISFFLIFVAVYTGCRLAARFLSKVSESLYLGWLNRLMGGLIGGLKGAILISLILLIIGFMPFQAALQNVGQNSLLFNPLKQLIPTLYNTGKGFTKTSGNFESKITQTFEEAKIKLSEEILVYLFDRKEKSIEHE